MADTAYDPILTQAMLDKMNKDIELRRQQQIAQAMGSASTRGISGGSYEGRGVGMANIGAQDAATQAALEVAIKNADYANRNREMEAERAFRTSERVGSQSFSAEQAALDRQAQIDAATTAYERQKSESKRNRRWGTVTAGLSAIGGAAGQYAGSFGVPAAK